jgi:trk system potassium uptake protein TrkH
VILGITALIFIVGTPLLLTVEPMLRDFSTGTAICAAMFQIMTASSTAGFNSVPIAGLSPASLTLIIVIMVIGASPSGTGGGIKTTSLSSLLAIATCMLRGTKQIAFFGHEIPLPRLFTATAAVTMYMISLTSGLFLLCLTEQQDFSKLVFEAASALGTVGLSMGITGELTTFGKIIVTVLMFVGRVGPLTMGLAFLHKPVAELNLKSADLAV